MPATIIQITDPHLNDPTTGAPTAAWDRLATALEAAATFAPDLVVITGDIADRAAPNLGPRLVELLVRARRELRAPIALLPGNHDSEELDWLAVHPDYRAVADTGALFSSAGAVPLDRLAIYPRCALIALDSRLGVGGPGRLGADQLGWLASILTPSEGAGPWARELSERPLLLAMHHPPGASPVTGLHRRGLENSPELAQIIAASRFEVGGIVAGHYHHGLSARLGPTPVWVSPALSYNLNVFAPDTIAEGLDSPEFSLLRLGPAGMSAMSVGLDVPAPVFRRGFTIEPGATSLTRRRRSSSLLPRRANVPPE